MPTHPRRSGAIITAALVAATASLVVPAPAVASQPVSPSPSDVSGAVRYDPDGTVIGQLLTAITSRDDATVRFDAPFPVNFYGTRYPSLCVSTNGLVYPIASASAPCSTDYDDSVSSLAAGSQAPGIAPLALDLDATEWLTNPQFATPYEPVVTQVEVAGGVATYTTSQPHGYRVGNQARLRGASMMNGGVSLPSGTHTVTAVGSPTTYSATTGSADGTYLPGSGPTRTMRTNVMDDIDALTLSGTTLTVDSDASSHRLGVGQPITIEGTGIAGLDGIHTTIASVVDADEFTITVPASVTDVDPTVAGDQTTRTLPSGTAWHLESDGVGGISGIYFGETTVDGRPAYVITWYRHPGNDADGSNVSPVNPGNLSNTVQLVVIRETTGSDGAGWDIGFEFNVGTAKDPGDGYSSTSPTSSCSVSSIPTGGCRWGMGVSNYRVLDVVEWSRTSDVRRVRTDAPHGLEAGEVVRLEDARRVVVGVVDATTLDIADPGPDTPLTAETPGTLRIGVADAHELFAGTGTNELVDGSGPKALVLNSLNTWVAGRYQFRMVGGAVANFTVPQLGTPLPAPPPGPVTAASATAGDGQATVSWTAPATGSTPVTYTVTAAPGGATCTVAHPATTCTVTGLTNGTAYTFEVVATASGGSSSPVAAGPVTPAAAPAPTPTPAPTPAPSTPPGPVTNRPARTSGVPSGVPVAFDNGTFRTDVPVPASALPPVAAAITPSGAGMWTVTRDGAVHVAGDAREFGELLGSNVNAAPVGIIPTPSGNGYHVVTEDGGVFSYGDATFRGSMADVRLNSPVRSIAPTCGGAGYYLVAADGGVFAFGDAVFHGSMAGVSLNDEMLGIVAACDGSGYWTFARDGGVFTYGRARFYGSLGATPPHGGIVAMASTPSGSGYWLIGADRTVYAFGDAVGYRASSTGEPGTDVRTAAVLPAPSAPSARERRRRSIR